MEIVPIFTVQFINLSEAESETFNKKFPSSKDIEAFVETIQEEGAEISVIGIELVTFRLEIDLEDFSHQAEVKREVKRIANAISAALNEPPS
jgi:hypothetical protein